MFKFFSAPPRLREIISPSPALRTLRALRDSSSLDYKDKGAGQAKGPIHYVDERQGIGLL